MQEGSGKIEALGVSPGIGLGRALVYKDAKPKIPEAPAQSVEEELRRLDGAVKKIAEETRSMVRRAREAGDGTKADILDAIAMLIEDPALTDASRELIRSSSRNAAWAVQGGMDETAAVFEAMDDEYMRERASDIRDIQKRIIMELLGIQRRDLASLPSATILVAEDLTTSDTARMDLSNVAGIITCTGGQNAHASILARTFEIPAIVQAKDVLSLVEEGDEIVMDGSSGTAYVNPDATLRSTFERKRRDFLEERTRLDAFVDRRSLTADGHEVEICANIGTPGEAQRAMERGADGVGLFRSEFLYMDTGGLPDEETQFRAYREALEIMDGKPVVVRTMDVGGDKELPALALEREENPFLGYRAIRICLSRSALFLAQLKALLRAGLHGNLRIMFPFISSLEELRAAKRAVRDAEEELRREGRNFKEGVPLGIMIEIPAAAVMSAELAKECDFFSIGTNDLIQYTLAVDRGNEKVAALYSQYHPAVLRLIERSIRGAHGEGTPCAMCGEAAGDPLLVPFFLGLGLDEFSMNPAQIPRTREIVSRYTRESAKRLAEEILRLSTSEEVKRSLERGGTSSSG